MRFYLFPLLLLLLCCFLTCSCILCITIARLYYVVLVLILSFCQKSLGMTVSNTCIEVLAFTAICYLIHNIRLLMSFIDIIRLLMSLTFVRL